MTAPAVRHRDVGDKYDPGQETKAKMVWPCLKVFWFSKDNPTGHGERKKKRGRQKKRWKDNIKEWTGMDFASSTRAAEKRSRWKGILRIHVMPRRPSKVNEIE